LAKLLYLLEKKNLVYQGNQISFEGVTPVEGTNLVTAELFEETRDAIKNDPGSAARARECLEMAEKYRQLITCVPFVAPWGMIGLIVAVPEPYVFQKTDSLLELERQIVAASQPTEESVKEFLKCATRVVAMIDTTVAKKTAASIVDVVPLCETTPNIWIRTVTEELLEESAASPISDNYPTRLFAARARAFLTKKPIIIGPLMEDGRLTGAVMVVSAQTVLGPEHAQMLYEFLAQGKEAILSRI